MKKIYQSEASFKYLLYFTLLLISFLAAGLTQIAPIVSRGFEIFLIPYLIVLIPYIPLVLALTVCWDIMAEESKMNKTLGVVFFLLTLALAGYTWYKIGIPALAFG